MSCSVLEGVEIVPGGAGFASKQKCLLLASKSFLIGSRGFFEVYELIEASVAAQEALFKVLSKGMRIAKNIQKYRFGVK